MYRRSSLVLAELSEILQLKKSFEDDFPALPKTEIVTTQINSEWQTLEVKFSEDCQDIDPAKESEEPDQKEHTLKPVDGLRVVKSEESADNEIVILVHKPELSAPLTDLVNAFKIAMERFGYVVTNIVSPNNGKLQYANPTALHPRMKEWITWLANPSAVDWKTSKLDLSPIANFVIGVVQDGKQIYPRNSGFESRSSVYIHNIQNTICRLYLENPERWKEAFWKYIPHKFRKFERIQFHSIKLIKSVLIAPEVDQLPKSVIELGSLQEELVSQMNDLRGFYAKQKLIRTSNSFMKIVGKPFLKIVYRRISMRSSLSKKGTPIKLSEVLKRGMVERDISFLPYMPINAIYRRNILREVVLSKQDFPLEIKNRCEGLPFGAAGFRELLIYCRGHKDLSPPREDDDLTVKDEMTSEESSHQ